MGWYLFHRMLQQLYRFFLRNRDDAKTGFHILVMVASNRQLSVPKYKPNLTSIQTACPAVPSCIHGRGVSWYCH